MPLNDEKVSLLRKVSIFPNLREYELDIIARYSELVSFQKGEIIFRKGAIAENFYVLEKGRIGIINVEGDCDVAIAHILAGESFGELDFFGKSHRSATAIADEDSVLLRFPTEHYRAADIFREHPYLAACMLFRILGIISGRIWNVHTLLLDKTYWLQDLRKQLFCDAMTGLYNQTYLKEDFVHLLPDLGESAALLMIKPDNFKEINDEHGHEAGDRVLNLMAIFLQSELGEQDIGIRYSGDEFAAFLPNTAKTDAIQRAKALSAAFKDIDLSGILAAPAFRLQLSIGIALYPVHADNSEALVRKAHEHMMRAREAGGNRISVAAGYT